MYIKGICNICNKGITEFEAAKFTYKYDENGKRIDIIVHKKCAGIGGFLDGSRRRNNR